MSDTSESGQARSPGGPSAKRWPVLVLGLAAVGLTAFVTVQIEHCLHADHDDHSEAGHEDEAEHGHGEHGHGEHGHEEEGDHDAVELTDEQLAAAGVELGAAGPGKVVVTIDLPGELALDGEALAHVGPRVGGTVRKIKKKLGDKVNKGDVLAVLDSSDLAVMQGEVQTARERLKLAKATFDRKKRLFEEKIISEKEYVEAKSRHDEAKVDLSAAEAALQARTGGGNKGGSYSLIAPLTGTIVEWHVGLGEVLASDAHAYTIADLSNVWVNVTVYARDLPRVKTGQRARIRAEGIEEPLEAKISFISHTVDELTRSAQARIVLNDPGAAWRPGLFVTAEVEIDAVEANIVVPEAAIQRHEGAEVVFVREGARVEARKVEVGRHGHTPDDEHVIEIVAGLEAGESYVAQNSFVIKAELGKGSAGHEH